jgi:putative peptide zinc metalloprotease protein
MTRSLTEQLVGTGSALADGQIVNGLVGIIGCVMLLCPMAGVVYLSVKMSGRIFRAANRATAGRPRLRVLLCALALVGLTGLSYAWVSGITPKPLPKQPPIAPILQPGVSTQAPGPRDASTSDGGASHGPTGHGTASLSPTAVPGASAAAKGGSPHPSASTAPSASATASAPASAHPTKGPTGRPATATATPPVTSGPTASAPAGGPSVPATSPTPSVTAPASPPASATPQSSASPATT